MKSDEIRQNQGGQTGSSDKAPILKFSHIFCHVISCSLQSWVVLSHLLFLLFFLAKVNWHIRAWSHPSYLALSAQVLLWPKYHQIPASSLCTWNSGDITHNSHTSLTCFPGWRVRGGMVQNGRMITKKRGYILFYYFLHLVLHVYQRNQPVLGENCVNPIEDGVLLSWKDPWEGFVSSIEALYRELPFWLDNWTVRHTFFHGVTDIYKTTLQNRTEKINLIFHQFGDQGLLWTLWCLCHVALSRSLPRTARLTLCSHKRWGHEVTFPMQKVCAISQEGSARGTSKVYSALSIWRCLPSPFADSPVAAVSVRSFPGTAIVTSGTVWV